MAGYIYCMTNESYSGLVKIGKTRNDPEARAAQLSSSTGVPTRFEIAWSRKVADMDTAEAELHRALDDCRVSNRREFFKCKPSQAFAQAKRLPAFQKDRSSNRKNHYAKPEGRLGLSLAAMMVLMFLAACMFDLDAKTTVTGILGFTVMLTAFFWATSVGRMVRS